jgi:hypothetical protein
MTEFNAPQTTRSRCTAMALARIPSAIGCFMIGCITAACAHGGGGAASDCLLTQADSVHLQSGPVYRDCAVDRVARLSEPSVRVDYRPTGRPRPGSVECFYAEVHLVVDATGTPELETARLGNTNEPGWGRAVLAGVQNWKYVPALRDGEPVRQIVRERRTAALAMAVVRSGQAAGSPPPPLCR